jgi:hypothetical protein
MTSSTHDAPGTRTRRGTALVVLLTLAAAVAGTVWFLGHADRGARAGQALDATETALADAATDLDGAVAAGRTALESSAGQVEDEQTRTDLLAAIADAEELESGPATSGSAPERARVAQDRHDAVVAQTAVVQAATVDVAVSLSGWTLAQAVADDDAARAALGTALADGTAALATGAGDADAQSALAAAVADATAAAGTAVDPADLDSVLASTTAVETARAALESATRAVTG